MTTIAGLVGSPGAEDGRGSVARFSTPRSVTVDREGSLYVTDSEVIRKVTSLGSDWLVTTVARPDADSLTVDSVGNLYVIGGTSIRKLTATGQILDFAGTPYAPGSTDGVGSAARFGVRRRSGDSEWILGPSSLVRDGAGNLFVTEAHNGTIRKVTPDGSVTTLAGLAGKTGTADGTGSAARFSSPFGVAVSREGLIYVADRQGRQWGRV